MADVIGIRCRIESEYAITTENFDVTTRSVEYSDYGQMIERVEKQFGQLLRLARKLPEYRYRFALLHKFKEFERAVWVMPGSRRVRIII